MSTKSFNPFDHYWIIAGEQAEVYSSARNARVPLTDPAFVAFQDAGGFPSQIANETELRDVLRAQAPGLLPDWLYEAPSVIRPTPSTYLPAQLVCYAASLRYAREVAGIVVNDLPVATDDRSKVMIAGARTAAEADSEFTTPWVGSDGSIKLLSAADVIEISNAVLAHVKACFVTFTNVAATIVAVPSNVTTPGQVEAAMSGE